MAFLTPNMSLLGISIGIDSGITIEQNSNSNTAILDQHNHTAGSGVQIPPAGLNINSNLTFNGNGATNLGFANLSTLLSAPSTNVSLFSQGVDLYFLDGNGNSIQMTAAGSVLATSSGISSGTASASFSSSVLVVDSAPSTPGNIQVGSVLLGNSVVNSKFLTLSPPGSMAANFTLTLPSIPSSQSLLTIDTSGNIAPYVSVSGGIPGSAIANQTITATNIANQTITATQIANATITAAQIANQTITATQIANNTITRAQEAAVGQQVSSSCGGYGIVATTYTNVTNLTVTLTSTGRPVILALISDGSANESELSIPEGRMVNMRLLIDSALAASWQYTVAVGSNAIVTQPSIWHMLFPASGSHTYVIQANSNTTTGAAVLGYYQLVAYEL